MESGPGTPALWEIARRERDETALSNFQTIHKPQTLDEAAELVKRPGVYPIYGDPTSTSRVQSADIREGVDLTELVADECLFEKGHLTIDGGATLETLAACDTEIAPIVKEDTPESLRSMLTLGDILLESRPDSFALALLVGLRAKINAYGQEPIPMDRWFNMSPDERRQQIIVSALCPDYRNPGAWRLAFEKMPPTPGDSPIVASIGFASGGTPGTAVVQFYFVVCGLANRPLRYKASELSQLKSQIDDQAASAEHRTEIAKQMSNRVIMKAVMLAQKQD
jgi:CO/xanthine dehydrogenase FAD-binding subunit